MSRRAVFASLIALGAASGAAQAADEGPRLVNNNGSQEVAYGAGRDNVVGGAFATVTGGSDYPVYSAAPGARTEPVGPAAALVGGGENAQVVYAAPAAANTATASRSRLSPRG